MFEKLSIKNYLLLKNIELDLSPGFNIITGETGAGKSILINALSLLMGERADYSIISKNKDKMVIEGFLKISASNKRAVNTLLKENDIEELGENVIIRRELYTKGYSRNFINDSPVGTNELKMLGEIIIDIHSQNEHQSLLKKEVHIQLLDSYLCRIKNLKFNEKLEAYQQGYVNLLNNVNEYENLRERKNEIENKRNFVEFQVKEINDVAPAAGEDDTLETELKTGENAEGIQQALTVSYSNLYDDPGSVIERLKIVEKELSKIAEYNPEIKKILEDISQSVLILNESSRLLQSLTGGVSIDPERIEEIRERLYKLQFLKKKYGKSLQEVINLRDTLAKDLEIADNFDEKLGELEQNIRSLKDELLKKAKELSKLRKDKSKQLEGEVSAILKEVGFENAEFKAEIKSGAGHDSLNKNGIDEVEFMVKINKGDEFSSLRKTASGGEVSRIMLAVKTVLADADKVEILVFDEIDTGISGRIARKVGKVMKKLSAYRQVIAITHLAQIAALAEEHLLVEKQTEGESSFTTIRPLAKNEKVIEVAKLLSGEKVTDASIKSAKELIES